MELGLDLIDLSIHCGTNARKKSRSENQATNSHTYWFIHCALNSFLKWMSIGLYRSSGANNVGDRVEYTCNPGFLLAGSNQIVCTRVGANQAPRWSPNPPVCNVVGKIFQFFRLYFKDFFSMFLYNDYVWGT